MTGMTVGSVWVYRGTVHQVHLIANRGGMLYVICLMVGDASCVEYPLNEFQKDAIRLRRIDTSAQETPK